MILDSTRAMAAHLPQGLPRLWRNAADEVVSALSGRYLRRGHQPFSGGIAIMIPYEAIAKDIYTAAADAAACSCDLENDIENHEPGCLCVHEHILVYSLSRIAEERNYGRDVLKRMLVDNMELMIDFMEERS